MECRCNLVKEFHRQEAADFKREQLVERIRSRWSRKARQTVYSNARSLPGVGGFSHLGSRRVSEDQHTSTDWRRFARASQASMGECTGQAIWSSRRRSQFDTANSSHSA